MRRLSLALALSSFSVLAVDPSGRDWTTDALLAHMEKANVRTPGGVGQALPSFLQANFKSLGTVSSQERMMGRRPPSIWWNDRLVVRLEGHRVEIVERTGAGWAARVLELPSSAEHGRVVTTVPPAEVSKLKVFEFRDVATGQLAAPDPAH